MGSGLLESSPASIRRGDTHGNGSGSGPAIDDIPDIVIRRLPIYVRTLRTLCERQVGSASSEQLAEMLGVTAAQIRRDLSYFGKFGKQGKGYDTHLLVEAISTILTLDRQWPVVLAGLGNLGRAIANYRGFSPSSFNIAALFDRNPTHFGQRVGELDILPMTELPAFMHDEGIHIGIIATPKVHAQETADLMVAGGVQAILNYAPVILKVPETVTVREIDPVSALQSMTYYIHDEG
jgi:redox-sensing transcriptional repressor